MKKIRNKIIFSMFSITIFSIVVPRTIIRIFFEDGFEAIPISTMLLMGFIVTGSIILISASIWFNYIIARRLTHLTLATKKISQGEFNTHLEEIGCDEISQLTHHFNLMTEALNHNIYVNQGFMKNYAHEFKTPISIIKGYAELIEQTQDVDEMKEYASIVVAQSDALSKLAQNMLELSMLDSDQLITKNDDINISEQVRLIIQSMQPKWENKNINLVLELDDIYIKSNQKLVYIMLRNLIDNAITYANPNTNLFMNIKQTNHIVFEITNEGLALTSEDQEKMFDLFYRSEEAKHSQGHGVGLSIVKKIVDKLDYSIQLEVNQNITTFIITII